MPYGITVTPGLGPIAYVRGTAASLAFALSELLHGRLTNAVARIRHVHFMITYMLQTHLNSTEQAAHTAVFEKGQKRKTS